jgi:3',5'-cyclic AMP phosphodiesterase CpdA
MRHIAHISDLHFGTEIPAVVEALVADLQNLAPSLVIVSGDLTQRARVAQFKAAKEFLDRLPQPQLVVPGNHDVPLYDVVRRFASPLGRYARIVSNELNPLYANEEIFVIGLNTARSFTWQSGRISTKQLNLLSERLGSAKGRFKIVVTHHPFLPPPDDAGINLVGRAAAAIPLLDEGGVDLLLAGHLHQGYAGDIRTHYPAARRSIIAAQAGTATSGRTRNEANAYNLITLEHDHLSISVRAWDGAKFAPLRTSRYQRVPHGWVADSASKP